MLRAACPWNGFAAQLVNNLSPLLRQQNGEFDHMAARPCTTCRLFRVAFLASAGLLGLFWWFG
jgi:hypothetical protein